MRISKKTDPAVADILTRIARSGLSDQQVHERAGLPNGWLSQARSGRYGAGAASVKKLRRFIERLEAGELARAVDAPSSKRTPMDGLVPAFDPAPVAVVLGPDGASTPLGKAILEARTFRRLGALLAMIAAAVADGQIKDLKLADTLERLVKTRASILKKEREEQATAKVRSLEILTEDEVKLLAEYRAKLAGAPLKPGDYPPPPTESVPGDATKQAS